MYRWDYLSVYRGFNPKSESETQRLIWWTRQTSSKPPIHPPSLSYQSQLLYDLNSTGPHRHTSQSIYVCVTEPPDPVSIYKVSETTSLSPISVFSLLRVSSIYFPSFSLLRSLLQESQVTCLLFSDTTFDLSSSVFPSSLSSVHTVVTHIPYVIFQRSLFSRDTTYGNSFV